MSRTNTIGDSLVAHIRAELGLPAAAVFYEPTAQLPDLPLVASVFWQGGDADTEMPLIGADATMYVDNFSIQLTRTDGDTRSIADSIKALAHSLMFDWAGVAGLYERQVRSRLLDRQLMESAKLGGARTVALILEVKYSETADS